MRAQYTAKQNIDQIQRNKNQTRNQGGSEKLANRQGLDRKFALFILRLLVGVRHHIGQNDEKRRGRYDLPQRARCTDNAGRYPRIVSGAQHGGQGNHAHSHHGRAHNAGRGRQQRSYKNY